MRVVIDTNVITSRYLNPYGAPAQVLQLWQQQVIELLVSKAILVEYERVLGYEKIQLLHRMSLERIHQVIDDFREFATLITPTQTLDVIQEDPPDNRFLECALEGGAQYIISGDHHLRRLGEYQGIQVLSPREFLTLLEEHGEHL